MSDIKKDITDLVKSGAVNEDGELEIYGVTLTPSEINIQGYDELVKVMDGYTEKYANLIFGKKDLKDAKNVRKELNGVFKSLDDKRKEIKKEFNKPLVKFEADMKVITDGIKEVVAPIDKTIKDIEDTERSQREKMVRAAVNELLNLTTEYVRARFVYNDRWNNKTFTLKKTQVEVEGQIDILEREEKAAEMFTVKLELTGTIKELQLAREIMDDNHIVSKVVK